MKDSRQVDGKYLEIKWKRKIEKVVRIKWGHESEIIPIRDNFKKFNAYKDVLQWDMIII